MRMNATKVALTLVFLFLPFIVWGQRRSVAPGGSLAKSPGCVEIAATAQGETGHGLDLSDLDRSVKPCDDFYRFANGGWTAKNPIPPAYPSWGTFNQLQQRNQENLRKILEQAAAGHAAPKGSNEQKLGDFYASCMDTEKVEAEATKPIDPELARIGKISSVPELEAEVARLQTLGVRAPFGFFSEQDFKNSSQVIGVAVQGGLGLPDRDYYTKEDERSKELRAAYEQHVTKMLELLGDAPEKAVAEARTVMTIETSLARASMTRVERRNPDNIYHKMDAADLEALTPSFSWENYFQQVGFPSIRTVNVGQPDFFKHLDKELTTVSLADWKTYLRWHLLHAAAPALSSKFVEENFNFYGRTLTGAKEIQPRWKRCVEATDRNLGEALGQLYVKEYFPPEAKARALDMVHNLVAALRDDLATLDWMGPATRKQALAKLDAITLKIGYPDKWRDYSALTIDRSPYADNLFRARRFDFRFELSKIGKPVDRTEWGMTPPTVNAYYNASMNEIVFPAGILQPPFFDPKADDAVNYGGMGAVIGHELTHGFDDQGRKFDAEGNLRSWWTPEDLKNFQARAGCVAKQFDSYAVEPGLHENGKLVLGESIADLGGLTIAHAALEKALEKNPEPERIDGFTPEQRFFLAWAHIWANNARPEFERLMANTNPHPLGRFRTKGPVSNMPAFAKAFGCHAGGPMVRPESERCRIW